MVTETEYPLEASAQGIIASGTANQINIGPRLPGERWEIDGFSATGPFAARLQIMRGNSFDVTRQLDFTNRADGDSSDTKLKLMSGESISFWWSNGASGAVMTCNVLGRRFVPGRRGY